MTFSNAFAYEQSDVPEGVTLAQYRRSVATTAYPSNKAYAITMALSAAIVAAPSVICAWLRRKAER